FFFSSRRRHTRSKRDWSSDVCSSDLRRMQELFRIHNIDTVGFGAAAPLALMGKAAKQAGAKKVVATTHGHEVGWSMLPGARYALDRKSGGKGRGVDVGGGGGLREKRG